MSQADEPGAIPMLVAESRTFIGQNDHTWVVLHKTASGGSAQDIASYFASNPDMHSTHYVIGQDGAIVQCVLEKDGAGGNCCLEAGHAPFLPGGINLNLKTVSIEHVDPSPDNSTPLTAAQQAASFRLVRDICLRHSIPMRAGDATGGILGHNQIAPLSRARCPGNYPWAALWTFLQEGIMRVPTGWVPNPTLHELTAPNGIAVTQGFCDHIEADPTWNPANVPLAPAQGLPEEQGGGTFQIFRDKNLRWTPVKGVYEEAQGPLLLAALAQIGLLENQLASMKGTDPTKLAKVASLARQVEADASQLEAAVAALA